MLRHLIISSLLLGNTLNAFGNTINNLYVYNKSSTGYIVVDYNTLINGQITAFNASLPAGEDFALGNPPFPDVQQISVTSITAYYNSVPQSITYCPGLTFNTYYPGAIISVGDSLACSTVIQ